MNHQHFFSECFRAGLLFVAGAAILMASSAESLTWKRYAAPDCIQQVACDSENCWVVTNAGLTKASLTGGTVTQYTSENSSLLLSGIPIIAVDRNFDAWVLSQKLYRFKNGHMEDMSGLSTLNPSDPLWNIFTDPQGSLWAISADTLHHLEGTPGERWHFERPSNPGKFAVDTLGCLYILGGRDGLSKNDHGQTMMYTSKNSGLPVDQYGTSFFLTAIAVDADNVKWIGTDGGGLVRYDGAWQLLNTANSSIPFNYIETILACPNNRLWIMGQRRLASFDGHQWQERSDILSALPGNALYLRAADRSGRLYFATTDGRLYQWEQGTSREMPIATVPLAGNQLSGLAMDRHDVLWMVSDDPYTGNTRYSNICSFDGRNWKSFDSSASPLLNNATRIIAVDRNDTKWFAGTTLCTYDGTTWHGCDSSAIGFSPSGVTSLAFDSRNRPWIGTSHGPATVDGIRWKLFDTANSALPYPCVSSIAIDKNDTPWLVAVTPSAGWCENECPPFHQAVCTVDSAGVRVRDLSPFSISWSSMLACDSLGRIIVSIDSGIVRLESGQWNFIRCPGIGYVQSMMVDAHGRLWLTSYSGVFCLGPDGWTKTCLPDSQFSGSNRHVAFNSRNDIFYTGNDLGLFVGTADQSQVAQGKLPPGQPHHAPQIGVIDPFGSTKLRGLSDRPVTVAVFDLRGRLIATHLIPAGKSIDAKAIREKLGASTGLYIYKEILK